LIFSAVGKNQVIHNGTLCEKRHETEMNIGK
jgi:hypothetical protein